MELKVRDITTNEIYTNNMSEDNKLVILEIHFCTSYTQVIVQKEIKVENNKTYHTHNIILKPEGSKASFVDLIAINDDDHVGEFIDK